MVDRNLTDIAELKKLLTYDPDTGQFTWLNCTGVRRRFSGEIAGTCNNSGYIVIGVNQTKFFAHRIAWAFMTDKWPTDQIDHINRHRTDNRWINLREATHSQNQQNRVANTNNAIGLKGVSYHKKTNRWSVSLMKSRITYWLGEFSTPEAAHAAYCAKAAELAGEFFNSGQHLTQPPAASKGEEA